MKEKIINQLESLSNIIDSFARIGCTNPNSVFQDSDVKRLINDITEFSILIKDIFPFQSELLFRAKDDLFYGYNFINLLVLGRIGSQISYIRWAINENKVDKEWQYIHSSIIESSKKKFIDGHYEDAAFAACKQVKNRVQKLYEEMTPNGAELTETALMGHMFAPSNPKIKLYTTQSRTGENMQQGTQKLAEGLFLSVRNIVGHETTEMEEEEAFQVLSLASLLMLRIDYAETLTDCE